MRALRIKTPLSEETVRKISIGDILFLSGVLVTMRDHAHSRLLKLSQKGMYAPVEAKGLAVYHCGPLAKRDGGKWTIIAAGPTTSMRMEAFTSEMFRITGARVIIGKGGMGPKTALALKEHGAVYCDFTGGAAVLAAQSVKEVIGVKWLDLGMPEAVWVLRVENFGPLLVSMDSKGENLRATFAHSARSSHRGDIALSTLVS